MREVLDAAIEDGSALQSRLSGSTDDDDDSEVMSQLSDAALVASSVLATHGPASEARTFCIVLHPLDTIRRLLHAAVL